jgi:hypothetical protein
MKGLFFFNLTLEVGCDYWSKGGKKEFGFVKVSLEGIHLGKIREGFPLIAF